MRETLSKPLYILIPVYNEQATVYRLLENVAGTDISEFGLALRIIVIDDGSTDDTRTQIERFTRDYPDAPVTRLRFPENRGKGRAIREGLGLCEDAEGIVLIQDADLEYDPQQYPLLLKPLAVGLTRVVYGSRWIFPGPMSKSGLLYTFGGWLLNQYLKILYRTNISDIATCYKVMPAGLLKSLDLKCNGFEFCPEVTAKLLNRGETVLEVPIDYQARKKSDGKKISWRDFFIAVYTLTRIRLLRK